MPAGGCGSIPQLADVANHPLIEWSVALRIEIARRRAATLKDVARIFNENWDRLETAMITDPGPLAPIDLGELRRAAADVLELADTHRDPSDNLAVFIADRWHKFEALRDGDDALEAVVIIDSEAKWSMSQGQKKNWPDVEHVRGTLKHFAAAADRVIVAAAPAVLDQWRWRLAIFTLDAAEQRRREGTLEFHDLLVLARRLVRRSPSARRALHERYTHLVIDEFQDTDPIQVELVTLIATSADDVGDAQWTDLDVEPGRLCFVGDPKQSIYRFRRADGRAVPRSVRAVSLRRVSRCRSWRTFARCPRCCGGSTTCSAALMQGGRPDQQPPYRPWTPRGATARAAITGWYCSVVPTTKTSSRDTARTRSRRRGASDSFDDSRRRPVVDRRPRPVAPPRFDDIVILVPSRLSLPALEHALRAADVPYRAEASTLVFDTQEVREPLIALQAIDDPSDEIAVVATCVAHSSAAVTTSCSSS
jgi:hypothetical protein